MPIRVRAILAIILTNLLIISFSVLSGIRYVGDNIRSSQETDLSVVSDIADHFISSEIELLKMSSSLIAHNFTESQESDWEMVLAQQVNNDSAFIGIAVLDRAEGLLLSGGALPVNAQLLDENFIMQAFGGRTVFSSTYPSVYGMVFYIALPLDEEEGRLLVLTLPGMHFSDRLSSFVIWHTGHIFIVDAEGYMIANMREHWVQDRINFFHEAEQDNVFEPVAQVLRRVVNGETGVGYFPMAGVPRLCSFRPVTASLEGWGMGIIAPLPESPFRDIDRGLVMVGFVGFALSIIVALIASDFVKKPFEEIAALKEAAENNSRYKSTFLANMSHEMRTPMNAIIGMTSIAKTSPGIDRKNYALDRIENASLHLLGVINDVLDMSKIEANKLEISNIIFSFEKLIQKVVNVISFRIDERHQNFIVDLDKNIPSFILGDDQRLSQVITNLLSNAVKFTPDGGSISLIAKHLETDQGPSMIQIDVKDTGIGISKEQQKNLFQSFQQAESGTSREFGGTGLGLAISKRIVELLGGTIWIDSELGMGTTFSFTFIAEEGEGGDTPVQVTEESPRQESEIGIYEGRCMLLAEDIEINQEIIISILEPTGISIDCAGNGLEAVEKFTQNPDKYDLIFMDIQMPKMDGYEATQQIRDIEREYASQTQRLLESSKRIPIIAMTANVFREDVEKCIAAGMNDHLGKPLDLGELMEKLKFYLKT